MNQLVIALLGRKDAPTDAVEEYCRYLGEALRAHDIQLEIHRVPWDLHGWSDALRALQLQAAGWRKTWVLVQYTALAWSARGFPQKVLRALKILKTAGACIGVIFHDVEPYPGTRLIDSLRRSLQIRTMRRIVSFADLAIFTVPPDKLSWRPVLGPNVGFIPVGPNLPIPPALPPRQEQVSVPTIGVFSITGGEPGSHETRIIVESVRYASEKLGKLRLCVFGRHAEVRGADLRAGLEDSAVELTVQGVGEPESVVQKLSACDVLLFVRGNISSRRSSAIAGIACGLPIIAFPGSETTAPITEAGVVLVPPDEPDELPNALVRVLSSATCRADLAARSRAAYQSYFAWPSIAARFADSLKKHT